MTQSKQVTVSRVIDGDTIEVEMGGGLFQKSQRKRVRLYGIDAPESSQQGGKESTEHLKRLIGSRKRIWLDTMDVDRYGRTVGLVYPRREHPADSYNYAMVRDGQARSYMAKGKDRKTFEEVERAAAERGWGIWKKNAAAPWQYRREQRQRAERRGKLKLRLIILLLLAAAAAIVYSALGLPLPQLP